MADIKRTIQHIVVHCHPELESVNAAMAAACCAEVRQHGHEAIGRGLHAMGFDPILAAGERPGMALRRMPEVRDDAALGQGADVLALIYPIWFGGPPEMLKGYLERVLESGAMPSRFKQEAAAGVLAQKRLVSFTSSATDEHWLATPDQLESLISGFDRYIEHGLAIQPSQHFHLGSLTSGMAPQEIGHYLREIKARARLLCLKLDQDAMLAA